MRIKQALMVALACLAGALLLLAGGAIAAGQSAGQKAAPAQNNSSAAALRVTARLVQVNVVAQDKDGKPVTDLTKDDFTVMDAGVTQKIAFFSPLTAPPVSTAEAPARKNVFSNRQKEAAGVSTSVTIIMLDAVNTDFKDMSYARAQVLKFVRQASAEDQVALYLLTSTKLYILHDFTSDSATLVRVLGGAKKEPGTPDANAAAADAANKRMNKALGDAFAESNRFYKGTTVDRAAVTSEAMQDIAKRVAPIPGRKSLVWVSSGFPITIGYGRSIGSTGGGGRASFVQSLSNTAKALNNANVSVYPVDARGLIAPDVLGVLQGNGNRSFSAAAPDDRPFQTMINIANGTGGRAFYNGNDIAASIRRAVDDSRESYAIGYYPDHNSWDGKFRQITVKVNRPGVSLRYRGGYFAGAESTDSVAQQKQALADAIRSPVQLIDLGLEVHAEPADGGGGRQLKVRVRVNAEQLHFEQNGDRWTDSIDIVWVELSADERIVGHGGHRLAVKPAQSGYEEILRDGLSFSEHVSVNAAAIEMRLAVRDGGSGAMGSVNIPLGSVFAKTSGNASSQ